jgi:hypothetical protein
MKAVPPQLESKWAGSTDHVAHDRVCAAKMFEGLTDLLLIHSTAGRRFPRADHFTQGQHKRQL